jgi:carboxylesterase
MLVHDFARPYRGGAGTVGVLFCHGFTATPWTLREWAIRTEQAGHRVSVPRLPGHGTTWQELEVTGWQDWYAAAERAFLELRAECDQVFVAGLSMGGCLALRLAEHHPDDVAGLVLVNPAVIGNPKVSLVPVLEHLVRSTSSIGSGIRREGVTEHSYPRTPLRAVHSMMRMWADVRSRLDLVHCPLLMFRSAVDNVVPTVSKEIILKQVSSEVITDRVLTHSDHVAPIDNDAELIFEESLAFFAEHSRP